MLVMPVSTFHVEDLFAIIITMASWNFFHLSLGRYEDLIPVHCASNDLLDLFSSSETK